MTIEDVKKKVDFIGGKYLDSRALPEDGIEVTIKSLKTEMVQNLKTFKDEEKKVLYFEEFSIGMILGAKINRVKLMQKCEGKEMKGAKVTIYRDPSVKFGKQTIGAIRVR
jgi:hypothetical protein